MFTNDTSLLNLFGIQAMISSDGLKTMLRPTKILIVDDDPGHLTALKTITRSWGHAVETADDGDAAVALVKSEPIDLVLIDVRMARMSGTTPAHQAVRAR